VPIVQKVLVCRLFHERCRTHSGRKLRNGNKTFLFSVRILCIQSYYFREAAGEFVMFSVFWQDYLKQKQNESHNSMHFDSLSTDWLRDVRVNQDFWSTIKTRLGLTVEKRG